MEAAAWRPRVDPVELTGLVLLGAAGAALIVGAVTAPLTALLLVSAGCAALVFLARTDLAILLVVATAPLEGEFASGPAGIIVTQFGHDRVLQRRIAWTLAITCSIAAALGLNYYLVGKATLATLPNANSNDYAFVLATSLPLMFVLLNSRFRLLVLAMIGLVSAATLLTLSRGALLGIGAGFLLFVLTDRRRVQLALTAGAIATIGTVLVIRSNPQQFHQAVFLKQQVAQQNVTTRFQAWGAAARLATDHPFLGVGPGNFQFYYNKLTGQPVGGFTLTVAHNALLDVGAELGLIAMCLLAVYLLLAFIRLTSSLYEGYGDPAFVSALRVSLTIAFVSALFLSEQYFLPFWLIGGLASAIWVDGRNRAAATE